MTLTGFLFLSEALLSEVDDRPRLHHRAVVGELVDAAVRRARPRLPERAARRAPRPVRSSPASSSPACCCSSCGCCSSRSPAARRTRSCSRPTRTTRQHDRPLRELLQRDARPDPGDRRHHALAARGAAAATAAAADAGGLAHRAGADHPGLLRADHRRVHPLEPGDHLRPARVGAARVPVRHALAAARARRDGRPRRRAPARARLAAAGRAAGEGARRPVARARVLAAALRRLRRRRRDAGGAARARARGGR